MAFLGDLIVRIGANANPFTTALKKAQSMTQTFRSTLKDMEKTASTFAKIAASIKAVNNQMDRLIHVSRRALDSTQNLARAEHLQAMNRMRELKMLQSMQQNQAAPRRTSMLDIAGGIGIASTVSSAAGAIRDMAVGTVSLAADAQVMRSEFGVLLGDVNKGATMFGQLEKFASRTSFNLESASDAMRSLMAAGVGEDDLLNTMQLLGDLSLGDANKLGFLSKAYTDVFNKGRLQGQEIKQFAENGVGLVQALSATLKKPADEILKMSENGQISFKMMQDALKSLTAEGGRFYGAMEARNKTFRGQWDSIIENIQSTGRALGEMVLPKLTLILTEANKIVTAFNNLGDARWKFLGDVIVASFDVGMETIKLHWADMLNSMIDQVTEIDWAALVNPFAGVNINDLRPNARPGDLQAAQARLQGLIGQLQGAGDRQAIADMGQQRPGFNRGWIEREVPKSLADAAKSMFKSIESKIAAGKMGIGGMVDRAKIQAEAMASGLSHWFNNPDWEKNKAKRQEPQLAGAMAAGSQEAFSTIFAAMLQRGKDPNVKATEKQTKEVVKALKENKPQMILAMGAVGT